MRYDQVDIALSFLESEDLICIQVPYSKDIRLVANYLKEKLHNEIFSRKGNEFTLTENRRIIIEPITEYCGYGFTPDHLFFIDREHDRSYMKNLKLE